MKWFFVFMPLFVNLDVFSAQGQCIKDTLNLLENKIWRAQLPKGKQYAFEMEFRSALWTSMFLYNGQEKEFKTSYRICSDTIITYEEQKKYRILELTDSTLIIQYLPDSLTIGNGPVKYINTINSSSKRRENEVRLDSIWRKEDIWNKGIAQITGEPVKDLTALEAPQWASWKNLEDYFIAQMKYPSHLLAKNQAGYSVAMFSLDTLGLPRSMNILTSIHKDFDKEVLRLIKELPHCLPCRDKMSKRIECWYTVYVPFLPQHYRDRVKADSIAIEEQKHCFIEWEEQAKFQDGSLEAVQNYILQRLVYNPDLLGNRKQVRGIYSIKIDSYGEVIESKTVRSCGIPLWDEEVVEIIKSMPRWIPAINHRGKGEYRGAFWTVPVVFFKDKPNSDLVQYDSITRKNVYTFVEKMPYYQGGNRAFMNDFSKNFHFTFKEHEDIQTKLRVQFVITRKGRLIGGRIYDKKESELTSFEKEGLRALRSMQNWEPGKHHNENVDVIITRVIDVDTK